MSVERLSEKLEQSLLAPSIFRSDRRQDVWTKDFFDSEFRPDPFRLRQNISVHQPIHLIMIPRDQQGLAILVILWSARTTDKLLVLQNTDWISSEPGLIPLITTDYHRPGGKIHPCCQGRSCSKNFDPSIPERVLDYSSVCWSEARVMESCPRSDLGSQCFT